MLPRLSNMKIYTSHIDDFSESDFERICNTVPDKLIEKSLYIKKEHSKKESLLGRYILFCVASANGIDIDSILYGENGKPYIENYKLSDNKALEWMGEHNHLKGRDQDTYDYEND